jgi:hypothetical protein
MTRTNTMNGTTRLVALGRLPAATRDAMGDTLGSFSGLALEPGSWRAAAGGYAGVFVSLPDRGFNIPEENKFSNFATRVHRIAFELRGETLQLTPLDTRFLRDEKGALTTGLDPGSGSTKQFGERLPSPDRGPAKGRLSIDSEGLAIKGDGTFFVSDEFGPNIYACAPDGRMTGVIVPPDAFTPHCDGDICFSSRDVKPSRGRAPNDGFEGLSLSPDGKTLFALLQSPLMQDREGKPESRRYTRLLAYDVSGKKLPRKPSAHYIIELPLHGETPGGPAHEAAEANEVLALPAGRILVLTRESFGYGAKERHDRRSIVHKQVSIGALEGASDLSGSKHERKARSIMNGNKLDKGLEAVRLTTLVDIAAEDELNRFGLTAKAGRKGFQLLSAKWESLVLSPPIDAKRPGERLLFVGNDNDFRTRHGFMSEGAYDGGFEHDNMILVYRITLPD